MIKQIFTKLLLTYIAIILVTLLVVGVFLSQLFQNYYFSAREKELVIKGQEISNVMVSYMLGFQDEKTTNDLLLAMDKFLDARVIPMDRQTLLYQACAGFEDLGIQMQHKEIDSLLAGEVVVRASDHPIFEDQMLTVAVPMTIMDEVVGGIFLSASMSALSDTIAQVQRLILLAALAAIFLSTTIAFYLSKSISQPLQQMNKVALEISKGNFSQQVEVTTSDEVGQLAETFNYMAANLDNTIEALSQEKNKIENIMVSMTEGVIALDPQERLILVNPQARILLGLESKSIRDMDINEALKEQALVEFFREPIKSGQIQTKEFVLPDETILRVQVSPLKKNRKKIWGVVGVLQDVTEIRQLEQMRRDFVANVSHELRTPLTSIQGFVEALIDGLAEDKESEQRYLNVIREESLRLSRLINDLLDLTRLEKGKEKISPAPLSVVETVDSVITRFLPQVNHNKLQVIKDLPQDLPLALGDRDRIEQVLINLLNNAINFTPEGKKVTIKGRQVDDMIQLSIIDEGVGIPESEQVKIWERFHKVEKSRTRAIGGTGLGLAIVKQIVEAHGGTVSLSSVPEEGSVFTFTLKSLEK